MGAFLPIALVLFLAAILALWIANRQRRSAGLPPGRVVSADTGSWKHLEKPLYDAETHLTGRPDYVVEQNGLLIPVEVKSGFAPSEPHDSHLFQLVAYCLLIERTSGKRPPYGLLHYRNRTFAIDYTPELEAELLELLDEIQAQQKRSQAARSHDDPARCRGCGFRKICDQKLQARG
jgi:CRISPR-associated exonuclease Cas4